MTVAIGPMTMPVGGTMEYVVATLAFVLLCGFALVAYAGLDAIERDEEEGMRASKRQRMRRPVVATSVPRWVATPNVPMQHALLQQRWHGGSVVAHADWLEGRIRGLEERLDQLVRDGEPATEARS